MVSIHIWCRIFSILRSLWDTWRTRSSSNYWSIYLLMTPPYFQIGQSLSLTCLLCYMQVNVENFWNMIYSEIMNKVSLQCSKDNHTKLDCKCDMHNNQTNGIRSWIMSKWWSYYAYSNIGVEAIHFMWNFKEKVSILRCIIDDIIVACAAWIVCLIAFNSRRIYLPFSNCLQKGFLISHSWGWQPKTAGHWKGWHYLIWQHPIGWSTINHSRF